GVVGTKSPDSLLRPMASARDHVLRTCRDSCRLVETVESAWRDLRFACRLLRRQPLFAAAAIVTVAFGVGANTAVVSALETALLNPLGLRQSDRVMAIRAQFVSLHLFHAETSGVEFREMQSLTEVFS